MPNLSPFISLHLPSSPLPETASLHTLVDKYKYDTKAKNISLSFVQSPLNQSVDCFQSIIQNGVPRLRYRLLARRHARRPRRDSPWPPNLHHRASKWSPSIRAHRHRPRRLWMEASKYQITGRHLCKKRQLPSLCPRVYERYDAYSDAACS